MVKKRWRPNLSVATFWLNKLREMQGRPPAEVEMWAELSKAHKIYLLIATGLDVHRQDEPWSSFTGEEQVKIASQVQVGGDVAKRWAQLRAQHDGRQADEFRLFM